MIDFAMTDLGMILLIVVVPAVLFLMKADSPRKKECGGMHESQAHSKDEPCVDSKNSHDTWALDTSTNDIMKNNERFIVHLRSLPEELHGQVAQYLKLADVATACISCQTLQSVWATSCVWQVLGTRFGVKMKDVCVGKAREAVRLAVWCQDLELIKDLAVEVKRHPPGAPAAPTSRLLAEASRFIRRLRPCDVCIAKDLFELVKPSLSCHSLEAATAAKELLTSSRESSLPLDMLEGLDNSYQHGLLQQGLLASCMHEHEDMLQAQLSELEALIEEENKLQDLIEFNLEGFLLQS